MAGREKKPVLPVAWFIACVPESCVSGLFYDEFQARGGHRGEENDAVATVGDEHQKTEC
jgi:hypothetical protein